MPSARGWSLRARLLWLAGLGTALVVGGTTYLNQRLIEQAVEREAIDAAAAAAMGVAANLTERDELPSGAELEALLADFTQAVPSLRALTVARITGQLHVVEASTDPHPPAGYERLVREAVATRELVVSSERAGSTRLVAVPLERDSRPYGAVVATLSMETVERLRREARTAALVFGASAILVLIVLLELLIHRFVHQPFRSIREAMDRASGGDLQARARAHRNDEIGVVAAGLNAMLERVSDFNAALQRAVQRSTSELRERNRQLMESAHRLFAARTELGRAQRLAVAGQMAASVAHQIGTPLNLISGYVQMILQDVPPDSVAAARLRTVLDQISRVAAIVQGLLDQARRPPLERRAMAPRQLLDGLIELVRPALESAQIVLECEAAEDLPAVSVDLGQAEQVFLSLITNSIDAMPEGGSLRLSARADETFVEFEVADSGQGIAPEDQPRVFDPLFTTKQPGRGTGLGLTIVRDVVAAHGGSVALCSQPGEGTTVLVRLPRADLVEARSA